MPDQQTKLKRCGTYTWFGFTLPFERKLALIAEAGFQTICTWWDDTFAGTDGRKEEHFRLAERAGLFLEHTHLPYFGCDALWFPGEEGDALCARYAQSAAQAADAGIKTAVLHPFGKYVPENGNWSIYLARMRRIAERCEQSGIRLAVENLADNEALVHIVDALRENPFVGICFDTGHNHVTAPNDFSLLSHFSDRVFALHVHDNGGRRDEHLLPYEGTVDWAAFLAAVEQTDFDGSLMLEACWPVDWDKLNEPDYEYEEPPIPPEKYLARARKSCGRILGERMEG